jgi:hypothetical protein
MADDAAPLRRRLPDDVARLLAQFVVPHGLTEGERVVERLGAQLESFEVSYRETKNPLWVWRAVLACGHASAPVPAWVMDYLVAVAEQFRDLSQKPPKDASRAILNALDMNAQGPRSVFSRLNDGDEIAIAAQMHWHIYSEGQSETDAKYLVARDRGVSESKALRAWHKHRAIFDGGPPKP